jgi:WD40 repeat protein
MQKTQRPRVLNHEKQGGNYERKMSLYKGDLLHTLTGHKNAVFSVAISPDGQTLASGCIDKTIKLWNLALGKDQSTLTGHTNWVWSVAISPDGQTLASGSVDTTIKLWEKK